VGRQQHSNVVGRCNDGGLNHTFVVWFDIPGGKIPLITITEVGVAWAPDPNTNKVSSIVAQWRGILSTKSDMGGGTCMNGNGKSPGNGGLKCGVNSWLQGPQRLPPLVLNVDLWRGSILRSSLIDQYESSTDQANSFVEVGENYS
jgi:hypothetical protein